MDLPPDLEVLQTARSIAFGRHGFAQTLSQEAASYQKALVEKSFSSEQLAWVLGHGSAAGRVYAACLLQAIDGKAGGEALRGLLGDDAAVMFRVAGSCSSVPTTVAECARWLLTETPRKGAPEAVFSAD